LPTEKCLVVSFRTFSNISTTTANYKKPKPSKIFVDAGVSLQSKTRLLLCFKASVYQDTLYQ